MDGVDKDAAGTGLMHSSPDSVVGLELRVGHFGHCFQYQPLTVFGNVVVLAFSLRHI